MPGNFRNQNVGGELSSRPKVTVAGTQALIANLRAKNAGYQRAARAVVKAYGEEMRGQLSRRSPVDLGNMRDLAEVRFSEGGLTFQAGWWRETFTAHELRWYIPYVLFGTSRRAATPVHTAAEAAVLPRFRAALAQVLRDESGR
jgi:hypothetical protein